MDEGHTTITDEGVKLVMAKMVTDHTSRICQNCVYFKERDEDVGWCYVLPPDDIGRSDSAVTPSDIFCHREQLKNHVTTASAINVLLEVLSAQHTSLLERIEKLTEAVERIN